LPQIEIVKDDANFSMLPSKPTKKRGPKAGAKRKPREPSRAGLVNQPNRKYKNAAEAILDQFQKENMIDDYQQYLRKETPADENEPWVRSPSQNDLKILSDLVKEKLLNKDQLYEILYNDFPTGSYNKKRLRKGFGRGFAKTRAPKKN